MPNGAQIGILYIPQKINFDQIIIKNPPFKGFDSDKAKYLISTIYTLGLVRKDEVIKSKGFVNLSSKILQDYVFSYRKYFDYFIKTGLIEENDNGYSKGHYCKSYRITKKYMSLPVKIGITNSKLILKSNAWKLGNINLRKKLLYLEAFWCNDLSIDYLEACKEAELIYLEDKSNYSQEEAELRYVLNKLSIEKFNSKDWLFVVDNTSNRLHTLLTSLNKRFRKFVRFKGHKLVEIDIVNSQPLFVSSLLRKDHYINNDIKGKVNRHNSQFNAELFESSFLELKEIDAEDITSNLVGYIGINQNGIVGDCYCSKEYVKDVTSGEFYENFAKVYNRATGGNISRDEAKGLFFPATYDRNRKDLSKASKVFKTCYPNVFEVFTIIKQGNYKALACLLQKLESDLILRKVCKRISTNYPHIPLFTIHDSILTIEPYSPIVKRILKEEIESMLAITPHLRVTKY